MNCFAHSMRGLSVLATFILSFLSVYSQQPIQVGAGSYASFPPLSEGRTQEHWGDQSTLMQGKQLWITERDGQPIPTNDWWTGMINFRFADALWSYPAMVHPSETGVTVNFPSYWSEDGHEVKSRSSVAVVGKGFLADCAKADTWHDWDVEMLMPDKEGRKSMKVTLAHGVPFTYIELNAITPQLVFSAQPEFFGADGQKIDGNALSDSAPNLFAAKIGEDVYGIYLPKGCIVDYDANTLTITKDGSTPRFVVIGLLTSVDRLSQYAPYAYNVPRQTRVRWEYDEQRGEIRSIWSMTTENLSDRSNGGAVIQGFLPHAYKSAMSAPVFNGDKYLTPRGTMKMTTGNEFVFTHKFSGMLPWYPVPDNGRVDKAKANQYRAEVMSELIKRYANEGTFGNDTYWGGKGLVQMALNMTFALETGDQDAFVVCRDKLKAKLVDWLTYTPGEENCYFCYYPRWGGLVGEDTSYDSDTFNDHHFHYGYFTLAGAMLCLVDEQFKTDYGPMLRQVAKDYANWDHDDHAYPFLRTLDPWVGHSYAGGLGDGANSNGNGQESSSEAMQGWGGIYLLGVALGDKEMRDAGIFGWSTEARATREYWFDVDHIADRYGQGGNYDYNLYKKPYNTNITCKGIGWWTWFSGDPLHMHGIQWLPCSPALDYLSWDPEFVKWAYNDLMNTPGWGHKWFEDGTDPSGNPIGKLADDDWGSVTLAYMQRALPDEAAAIFDEAYAKGLHIAKSVSTSHISYFVIHSHRTYGDIDWSVNADLPTACAYKNANGEYTFAVYNPGEERLVRFYRDNELLRTVMAPKGKLIAVSAEPVATEATITSEKGLKVLDNTQLHVEVRDQYGAMIDAEVTWKNTDNNVGTIDNSGRFTVNKNAKRGSKTVVTAECTSAAKTLSASVTLTIDEPSRFATGQIMPDAELIEMGDDVMFELVDAKDQYGIPYDGAVTWKINGHNVAKPVVDGTKVGLYEIEANCEGAVLRHKLYVTPTLPNLAKGKAVVASSEENVGTIAASVNDGDASTRWGSAHKDGEWIYVDLGKECRLTSVNVLWEAAYARSYKIELAKDGAAKESYTGQYHNGTQTIRVVAENQWSEAATVTGVTGQGWVNSVIEGTARYVRVKALERGTNYGVSIFELQIHGIEGDKSPEDVIGIDISAPTNFVDEDKQLQLSATAWHLNGLQSSADVTWSASQGSISSKGLFTPSTYGTATIKATMADGMEAERMVAVNEVLKLTSLQCDPTSIVLPLGDTARFDLVGMNQFGGLIDMGNAEITVVVETADDDSGISVSVDDCSVRANSVGHYLVKFICGDIATTLNVTVKELSDFNLALNRPARAGSGQNANFVFDGDYTTRWQAVPGAEQWIQVELDGLYLVNRFKIVWERACASDYHIEVSEDGKTWETAAVSSHEPTSDEGWIQVLSAEPKVARYVRLVSDKLTDTAKTYGVSLYEMEVYGTERLSDVDELWIDAAGDCRLNVAGDTFNVYSLSGAIVRAKIRPEELTKILPHLLPGVYIANGHKYLVK